MDVSLNELLPENLREKIAHLRGAGQSQCVAATRVPGGPEFLLRAPWCLFSNPTDH